MAGGNSRYYRIELLGREPTLKLMTPVEEAEELGLRRAVDKCKVEQVWSLFTSAPEELPSNHRARHQQLGEKLHGGDLCAVAEVLRDLTWRRHEEDHRTTGGKRVFEEAIQFLVGELATARGIDVDEAESEIRCRLHDVPTA